MTIVIAMIFMWTITELKPTLMYSVHRINEIRVIRNVVGLNRWGIPDDRLENGLYDEGKISLQSSFEQVIGR